MAQSVVATESEMDKGLHPEPWYKEENHQDIPDTMPSGGGMAQTVVAMVLLSPRWTMVFTRNHGTKRRTTTTSPSMPKHESFARQLTRATTSLLGQRDRHKPLGPDLGVATPNAREQALACHHYTPFVAEMTKRHSHHRHHDASRRANHPGRPPQHPCTETPPSVGITPP